MVNACGELNQYFGIHLENFDDSAFVKHADRNDVSAFQADDHSRRVSNLIPTLRSPDTPDTLRIKPGEDEMSSDCDLP